MATMDLLHHQELLLPFLEEYEDNFDRKNGRKENFQKLIMKKLSQWLPVVRLVTGVNGRRKNLLGDIVDVNIEIVKILS